MPKDDADRRHQAPDSLKFGVSQAEGSQFGAPACRNQSAPATFRKEMAKQDLLDMKAKQLEEKEKDVKKLQRKLQRQPLITS